MPVLAWLVKVILVALGAILATEVALRIGSLGRPETPLEKRIRENVERNKRDNAA